MSRACKIPSFFSLSRERLPGWEDRLVEVLRSASFEPYQLGKHDCFRLATRVVEALTGEDLWTQWDGTYTSKRDALRRIAEFAGDFTTGASKLFGCEPQSMGTARRGDICEYVDTDYQQHLGVVMGVKVALLGPEGLEYLPREACVHFWRVG